MPQNLVSLALVSTGRTFARWWFPADQISGRHLEGLAQLADRAHVGTAARVFLLELGDSGLIGTDHCCKLALRKAGSHAAVLEPMQEHRPRRTGVMRPPLYPVDLATPLGLFFIDDAS